MSEIQRIDLGFRPRPWQRECVSGWRDKRFSVLVVHRRAGKTVLAVMRLIDAALRATIDKPRFGYVAPQRNQAKAIAWDYLKGYASKIPGLTISEQELWVEFPNGARVRIFGADNPDSLRGQYFDGLVLDEVAQMKSEVWGEILLPALADRQGWSLFIGTPKGINLFSELYFRARGDDGWFSASYDVYHTDALLPEDIERQRKEMSDNQFRQEFLCDFSASSNDRFIDLGTVDDATRRDPQTTIYDPLIMGVDVARFGDDRSVILLRRGRDARMGIEKYRGIDTMALAAKVAERIAEHHPDAVFIDESGVGGGVVDRLRQLGHSIMGINFGSAPDGPVEGALVANKRAEMWCKMRSWLKTGGAIPDDPELRADLSGVEYGFDAHNRILLERKEDMKKRGLASSDVADALALTFAHPVASRAGLKSVTRARNQTDWDPMAETAPQSRRANTDWNPFRN